jgi:uncharacterized protein YijF (DUF1287 family)
MAFKNYYKITLPFIGLSLLTSACTPVKTSSQKKPQARTHVPDTKPIVKKRTVIKPKRRFVQHKHVVRKKKTNQNSFANRLSSAARERTRHHVTYDGSYIKIGYPWGDVPQNIGVCTDVVIRSYRRLGIDLQQQVHKDMTDNFHAYPNLSKWSLNGPDTNIDHRRVYNMRTFLSRHGQSLPISNNPDHFKPGDIVSWQLGPGQGHVGIVVNQRSKQDPRRHLVVHNIAEGPKMEDVLFRFRMSGHYRYSGKMKHYNARYLAKNNGSPKSIPGIGKIPAELLR